MSCALQDHRLSCTRWNSAILSLVLGRFVIEMDLEIEALWCSEGLVLPSGTHKKTSDVWVAATLSFLFYEFWGLPASAREKRVNLASDKLQAGFLAQLPGRVRDPSNSSTVSAPRPKAMS